MAKKSNAAVRSSPPQTGNPSTPGTDQLTTDTKPAVVKVNNANLLELKHACDDVVKEFFARPTGFTPSHLHTDVRLALGYSATLIAFAAAYYGYRTPFLESKGWVTVGVMLYALLTSALAWYITYVEKDTIFVGKRRTVAARISTERLTITSSASSSATPRATYGLPFLSFLSPTPSASTPSTSITPSVSISPPYPTYTLQVSYVHTGNNGKALIRQADAKLERSFAEWFDGEGTMWRMGLEKELEGVLARVVGE